MTWGTSYFRSRRAAEAYYGQTHGDPKETVTTKLAEREIHIGRPPLKPGERLVIMDGGTRWGITDAPNSMCQNRILKENQ